MAVQWDKYRIGMSFGKLRILRGSINKAGVFKQESYSDDRTTEIVNAVASMMKHKLKNKEENNGYFGYDIPFIGKLILVDTNYDFTVQKKEQKRQKKY